MFSKGESVLRKRVMDGGFYLAELEGLFSKITREGVSAYVSHWIKNGRIGLDQGEKREGASDGTVHPRRHSHCRQRGGHWRAWLGAYGPRFEEPRAPRDSEGSRDLGHADKAARGEG